ncbi:MAG TPA: cytochrome c biogenesis protein CcdA [Gemmatimonadaceae bacterium]|uniref:Cytochrome c-type biogenesis protein CcdA, cytochrome c-type biogenesis protein n=1 Tax=uncultured Gemmatimonadetes bacterium Rifle_16ft_4_minimus_37772 TaxID=1665097 RepID=A0A0H4T8F2_9BACT|nr:cytochrome c-type biogenesis protein CcdA, cytochrome c-type biogenesis protein [uncultured Gemmatimonadetes bacterium Rifle_16ft_4_minimus_37772]HLA90089.1 cytochrome c biogenesis protein CcdA [Gemmatimonadaceae bacterium]
MSDVSGALGILIAFSAGLLSFLSPCVLPLVPSYVTFITGLSFEDVAKARRTALVHSLLFILGFTIIFVLLGATATALGRLLLRHRYWVSAVGGALIIVFGLYLLGVLNITAFMRERRVHLANKPMGYLGSVVVGLAFGAGWSPCLGPILGAILTYTASEADLARGLLLLFTYSLGLAVPFLAAALGVERFVELFAKHKGKMVWVNRIAGVLLIFVGLLLVTNRFTLLATKLQQVTPEFIRSRL